MDQFFGGAIRPAFILWSFGRRKIDNGSKFIFGFISAAEFELKANCRSGSGCSSLIPAT